MKIDEEDEEQALLMQASQGLMEERWLDSTPLEWGEFRAGGLVVGKNLRSLVAVCISGVRWSHHFL